MSRQDKKPWWILSYNDIKKTSLKYRSTLDKIKECKQSGDWECVRKLKSLLRRAWWGTKRYNKK